MHHKTSDSQNFRYQTVLLSPRPEASPVVAEASQSCSKGFRSERRPGLITEDRACQFTKEKQHFDTFMYDSLYYNEKERRITAQSEGVLERVSISSEDWPAHPLPLVEPFLLSQLCLLGSHFILYGSGSTWESPFLFIRNKLFPIFYWVNTALGRSVDIPGVQQRHHHLPIVL